MCIRDSYCMNTSESGVDKGMAQIHFENNDPSKARFPFDNSRVVPDDNWAFAFRIGVNVKYLAQYQHAMYKHFSTTYPLISEEAMWKCAVFSYNAPAWAEDWARAGLPADGGGELSEAFQEYSGCKTKFEWATLYVKRVWDKPCYSITP